MTLTIVYFLGMIIAAIHAGIQVHLHGTITSKWKAAVYISACALFWPIYIFDILLKGVWKEI